MGPTTNGSNPHSLPPDDVPDAVRDTNSLRVIFMGFLSSSTYLLDNRDELGLPFSDRAEMWRDRFKTYTELFEVHRLGHSYAPGVDTELRPFVCSFFLELASAIEAQTPFHRFEERVKASRAELQLMIDAESHVSQGAIQDFELCSRLTSMFVDAATGTLEDFPRHLRAAVREIAP